MRAESNDLLTSFALGSDSLLIAGIRTSPYLYQSQSFLPDFRTTAKLWRARLARMPFIVILIILLLLFGGGGYYMGPGLGYYGGGGLSLVLLLVILYLLFGKGRGRL